MTEWDELEWFVKMTYLDGLKQEFEMQQRQYAGQSSGQYTELGENRQQPQPTTRVVSTTVNWDEQAKAIGR